MDAGPSSTGNFDTRHGLLQTCALNATRKAAVLPLDIAFHRSMDSDLAEELDIFSERVLSVTNKVLSLIATVDQSHIGKSKGKAKVESQDDVVDNFYSLIVDATDLLLERTDTCLDIVLGKNKAPAIPIKAPVEDAALRKKPGGKKYGTQAGRLDPVIQHASTLPKPQLLFKRRHDNSDSPWHPVLSHKYNAKVPLGYIYHDPGMENTIVSDHPYQYEITHLSYPARMFTPCTPVPPTSLEDTRATWVDTPQDFQIMLSKLRNATEIAVDLEHHSYRTYAGFLCLMQISDRDQDWIIDLLAVRDEIETLNEVFTDPAIVKVFHGADSDIVWLQQDFNVYVVNLFDTFHASRLLEFPHHGLAHLLEMYCDFIPDKRYQLADWRIRPLPDEMLRYARSDTHFLLFIYDNLSNALLDRSKSKSLSERSTPTPSFSGSSSSRGSVSLLEEALARSAETSLKVYTKEPYDASEGSGPGGWDTLAKRWNKIALTAAGPGVGIGGMQRDVYKRVHWWRERVAREEDESTRYVLQNHTLFLIAEQPPADMATLLSIFRPTVPSVVKKRAKELLTVVTEAVKGSLSSLYLDGNGETSQISENKTAEEVDSSEKRDDVVMLNTEIQNLERESKKEDLPSIWRVNREEAAPSSSLFGTSISSKPSSTAAPSRPCSFATSLSSLFGGKSDIVVRRTGLPRTSAGHSNFSEVVFRINQSLTMAPAIPKIVEVPSGNQVENTPLKEVVEVPDAQIEIPYVPASQRPARREEKDSIVIVGQVQQKRKRKAERSFVSDQDVASSTKQFEDTASNAKEPQELFDFSSVPNILDDDPVGREEGEETEKRRKRQRKTNKKGGTVYGDFPAPPKAHSELKSGNKSQTFK